MLESVRNLCEVHDLSFLFFFVSADTLEDDSVRVLRTFLSERGVGHWPVLDADWSVGDMNLEWRLAMLFVHHAPVFFHMYADAPPSRTEYVLNVSRQKFQHTHTFV